jgi:hypothetical protein
MLRATALGLARVGEGETGIPTPEPIAAETWEPTGADAGTAVAGLAPLVTDTWPRTAPSRVRAARRTPIAARRPIMRRHRWERPPRLPLGQSKPRP